MSLLKNPAAPSPVQASPSGHKTPETQHASASEATHSVANSAPAAGVSVARSGRWFLAVGAAATLTHMAVFALLEGRIWPELANGGGFVAAFLVSFVGHRFLSFADTHTSMGTSFVRFGLTALLGFAANELVFVLLLRSALWPSWLALLAGLLVAAAQTFVLSRYWAFKR